MYTHEMLRDGIREFSYTIHFNAARTVPHILVYVNNFWRLLNFCMLGPMFEMYEIKLRTKFSAIIVCIEGNGSLKCNSKETSRTDLTI